MLAQLDGLCSKHEGRLTYPNQYDSKLKVTWRFLNHARPHFASDFALQQRFILHL